MLRSATLGFLPALVAAAFALALPAAAHAETAPAPPTPPPAVAAPPPPGALPAPPAAAPPQPGPLPPPPGARCDDIPAEPTSLGDPTGFHIVVRRYGDQSTDGCRVVRAEKTRDTREIIHDWDESKPIPHGFHPEKGMNRNMVISGVVTASVGYALSAVMGLGVQGRGYYATIPFVGPFVAAATIRGCTGTGFLCDVSNGLVNDARAVWVLNGVAQITGTALVIAGLTSHKWTLVPDERRVMPVPMIGPGTTGMGLVGTF
jgi:hypothetical protein